MTDLADSVPRFALDLRALKHERKDPTLIALEARTGISKSTHSSAFGGKKLPSEKTLRAILAALDEDPEPWVARRNALLAQLGAENGADCEVDAGEGEDPSASGASQADESPAVVDGAAVGGETEETGGTEAAATSAKGVSRRVATLIAAITAVLTMVATSAVWALVILPQSKIVVPAKATVQTYTPFADGVDPMLTVCQEDAVVAGEGSRLKGQFYVEMLYSNQCMAAWGRVTRYDEQSSGNSMTMVVYPEIQMVGPRTQERSSVNLQSMYTTLLIEPNVEARVCGLATITQDDGKSVTLSPPVCI